MSRLTMSRLCLSISWMLLFHIFFLLWLDTILSQTAAIRGGSNIIVTSFLSALVLTLMPRYTTSICPLIYSSILSEKITTFIGEFLLVQWLGLWAFTAECPGSVPRGGTQISEAAWHGRKKKMAWTSSYEPTTMWRMEDAESVFRRLFPPEILSSQ